MAPTRSGSWRSPSEGACQRPPLEGPSWHRTAFPGRNRADPRHRRVDAFDRSARDEEGARLAGPDDREPLLRGLDANALLLRDGAEMAVGRLAEFRREGQLRRKRRVAARH